jgi:hypothetical protein
MVEVSGGKHSPRDIVTQEHDLFFFNFEKLKYGHLTSHFWEEIIRLGVYIQ